MDGEDVAPKFQFVILANVANFFLILIKVISFISLCLSFQKMYRKNKNKKKG